VTKHSDLIDALGSTDERIKDNPTSERLFKAADLLLYEAAEPVLRHTDLYDECMAAFASIRTVKKISNHGPGAYARIAAFVMEDDPAKKLVLLREAKLNRDLVAFPLRVFLSRRDRWMQCLAKGDGSALAAIKKSLCARPESDLTLPMLLVAASFGRYLEMRSAILEKYNRMIVREIGKYRHVIGSRIDPQDFAVSHVLAAMQAFARFDSTAGAFTSYLTHFFKSARSKSLATDETGVAYLVPGCVRAEIAKKDAEFRNWAQPLPEDDEGGIPGEEDDDLDRSILGRIMDEIDPDGMYRVLADLEVDVASLPSMRKGRTEHAERIRKAVSGQQDRRRQVAGQA